METFKLWNQYSREFTCRHVPLEPASTMIGNHNQRRKKERMNEIKCTRRGKRNRVKLAFKEGGLGRGKMAESVLRIHAKRVNKYKTKLL
jgi:hypothetical protein